MVCSISPPATKDVAQTQRIWFVCAGAGLDFVWPYLAGYPEDKIAVIDDTCMMRPSHILGPSASTQVRLVYKPGSMLMRRASFVKAYCIGSGVCKGYPGPSPPSVCQRSSSTISSKEIQCKSCTSTVCFSGTAGLGCSVAVSRQQSTLCESTIVWTVWYHCLM